MKKVLVPVAIYQDNPNIPVYGARPTYIKKLTKYGLLPLFVTPGMNREMISELYNQCDGVYFIAGEDWDPALYKQKKHPETFIGEPERDAIEFPLIQRTLADRKPCLGICRGAQGIAIASGGTLVQHLPDLYPHENHNPNKTYDDLLTSKKHPVLIDKKSRIYQILKKERVFVNSYHHQGIETPGKDMRIVGRSPAGVTEIIEHTDPTYFCYGVGCHPEAPEESFFENLFQAFADHVLYAKKGKKVSKQKVTATFYTD